MTEIKMPAAPKATNWQQVFTERMDTFKKETIFPDAEFIQSFPDPQTMIIKAFSFHSFKHLQMEAADYVALLRKTGNYTLREMEHVFAAMQNKTMHMLGMDVESYCSYITEAQRLIDVWAEMIRPEQEAVSAYVKANMDAERDAILSSEEFIQEEIPVKADA